MSNPNDAAPTGTAPTRTAPTDTAPVDSALAALAAERPQALARLEALLRIPSISAQPAHAPDCAAAAALLAGQFAEMGYDCTVHETAGQPVLLARHPGPGGTDVPHVLFYGHYDVQPPDPLEGWSGPPFTPRFVEGPHGPRVVARGAADDKGQVMMWVEALRAWQTSAGAPPVQVSVLIEGEEEIGSPNLENFLAAHRADLAADVAVISDTGMWSIDQPAITTRLRGLLYVQIDVQGPSRDLHSGLYGGAAANPLTALARALAGLHDLDGRITLPGFYDAVLPIEPAEQEAWAKLAFDEAEFLADIGLSLPAGERGLPTLHRLWARPAADLNGLWGGYMGEGSKTVIPSSAHAKLSLRLVPDQDPAAIEASLRSFLRASIPADLELEVTCLGAAPGIAVSADNPWVRAAGAALEAEYQRAPVLIGSGGSIPVVESLRRQLAVPSLLLGFGLADDRVHSPDEKFELRCYDHGARTHVRLLGILMGARGLQAPAGAGQSPASITLP